MSWSNLASWQRALRLARRKPCREALQLCCQACIACLAVASSSLEEPLTASSSATSRLRLCKRSKVACVTSMAFPQRERTWTRSHSDRALISLRFFSLANARRLATPSSLLRDCRSSAVKTPHLESLHASFHKERESASRSLLWPRPSMYPSLSRSLLWSSAALQPKSASAMLIVALHLRMTWILRHSASTSSSQDSQRQVQRAQSALPVALRSSVPRRQAERLCASSS
mmetsp:Transcript_26893/g.59062  ORF Transcript_26893/g.59062 Transcript_26893/m.59062 type:complete len:229 (+) Transcript_26893:2091-2777(+)